MVNLNRTFYDKTCNIYRKTIVDKDWTEVPETSLLYEGLMCDFYIAPRWNVVNFIPEVESRNTQEDRFDCVIPADLYDESKPIIKWDVLELYRDWTKEWTYVIDQMSIYRMPNGRLENVYLRLNNANQWRQPWTPKE